MAVRCGAIGVFVDVQKAKPHQVTFTVGWVYFWIFSLLKIYLQQRRTTQAVVYRIYKFYVIVCPVSGQKRTTMNIK